MGWVKVLTSDATEDRGGAVLDWTVLEASERTSTLKAM